jgi:tripartite-type tricarboxylate transporter receptor subunit TctC
MESRLTTVRPNFGLKILASVSIYVFVGLLTSQKFALGQDYPSRPITLVAPSTQEARPTYSRASSHANSPNNSGQQIVVLNRPGAGTSIGTASVSASEADGYTLLLGSIANTLNPHIMRSVGYRLEDFAPVSSVAAAPDVWSPPIDPCQEYPGVNCILKSKPGTPQDMPASARLRTCRSKFFAAWPASSPDGAVQRWRSSATGILRGRCHSCSAPPLESCRSCAMVRCARSSFQRKRIAAAPDLLTVAESGLPGFDVVAWFGFFVPAGTPKPIIDRLSTETRTALATPDVRKLLVELGAEPLGSTPDVFATYVKGEFERWGKMSKEAGITIE